MGRNFIYHRPTARRVTGRASKEENPSSKANSFISLNFLQMEMSLYPGLYKRIPLPYKVSNLLKEEPIRSSKHSIDSRLVGETDKIVRSIFEFDAFAVLIQCLMKNHGYKTHDSKERRSYEDSRVDGYGNA